MVIYDLVVIGGGYWGCGIAYEALKLGWRVAVIDSRDKYGASRAASAICDPNAYRSEIFQKYLPSDWTQDEITDSINWLYELGAISVQESFWNVFQSRTPRAGAKAIYLNNPEYLINKVADRTWNKEFHRGSPEEIETADGCRIAYRRLVIAAGYLTDKVLEILAIPSLGVGKLYGRGITAEGKPRVDIPVSVMIKPYVKHTVRFWDGGRFKVGDTAEKTPSDSKLENLRSVGRTVLAHYREVELREGYRPVCDRFTVAKLKKNLVVATGGHRVGLGLTGLVAKKVLGMFR